MSQNNRNREHDVIIIGGGLAGLIAAAAAVNRGKKVLLMAKGAGTLIFGGGTVDLLGYITGGRVVANPQAGLQELADDHPYRKIGQQKVEEALQFFLTLCSEEGYAYLGDVKQNYWLPTAAGTLKPSCFVPQTMDPTDFEKAEKVVVVGFNGLKDYYPQVLVKGLSKLPGYAKQYSIAWIDPGFEAGRDVSALDIARWLDTDAGQRDCIMQMRQVVPESSVALVPPVLGIHPNYQVARKLEQAAGYKLIETTGLPPAVIGFRLRTLLLNFLRNRGVTIMEQAVVGKAIIDNGRCLAVTTTNVDRERSYYAKAFVLATGGILGGGLSAEPSGVTEAIFHLAVTVPADPEAWGRHELFAAQGQPFAKFGVAVDDSLRPVDDAGQVVLENVYIAGRSLAGYDYCLEKSGNGVAIASGYQSGMSV
ncbi:MAG TPA: anaerobic glycerol-3-phosphate dehydrogenase subunit GlpB [Negativicutes bacterium]